MGIDAIALQKVYQIVKNSDKMSKGLETAENAIIDRGLELIEEAGIDPNTLPIDVRSLLRGETPTVDPNVLLTPQIICAQPIMTVQQKEKVTRLVTAGQDKIQNLINLTNSISDTVLVLQQPINNLQEKIAPAEENITFTSDIVEIIKLLALPTSFGTVGQPNSVNNTFADILITLGDYLKTASAGIITVQAALQTMTTTINDVSSQVNAVSILVGPFSTLLTMIQSIVNLQDQCPVVGQGEIDFIGTNLANDLSGSLAQAAFFENPFADSLEALESSLAPNSPNPVIYKNFRLVLEFDPIQLYSFPSRRIKCIRPNSVGVSDGIVGYGGEVIIYNNNPQVNPELEEGGYSYAKNVRVLINEAKFAIDVYTANITLWEAPPVRDRIQVTGSMISYYSLSPSQQEQYRALYGVPVPGEGSTPLPSYILYGGSSVNLNSSPTDIEYGADTLVGGRSEFSRTLPSTSYITSGTIQVNAPISIKLTTFGGTGNPNASGAGENGNLGFTTALLTIKRSTAIQDNINPFTGKIIGIDQDAIDNFTDENGLESLDFLENIYQTLREDTLTVETLTEQSKLEELIGSTSFTLEFMGLGFLQKLNLLKNSYFGGRGNNNSTTDMPYRDTEKLQEDFPGIGNIIELLYQKAKPLLYDPFTLDISRRLYGRNWSLTGNVEGQSWQWIKYWGGDDDILNEQWNFYEMARKNAFGEDRLMNTGGFSKKAATLGMFSMFLQQVRNKYTELFGVGDYDTVGGEQGWIGGATAIPILPTSLSSSEDVQVIQILQTAGRDETLRENVGGIDILGTYTYDLEIIDSLPEVGGAENNYPLNYTNLQIKDFKSATELINITSDLDRIGNDNSITWV